MKLLDKYPVETAKQRQDALEYFQEYESRFNFADRVKYASALAGEFSREEGFIPEKLASYTGEPRDSVRSAIVVRDYITGGHYGEALDAIEKIAEYAEPEDLVVAFHAFDTEAGLDDKYHRIPNPFASVFKSEKIASLEEDPAWRGGPDTLYRSKFIEWFRSPTGRRDLENHFGAGLVENMSTSGAWDVFSSLPDPHKKIIARMANDNVISTSGAGASLEDHHGRMEAEDLYESPDQRLRRIMGR